MLPNCSQSSSSRPSSLNGGSRKGLQRSLEGAGKGARGLAGTVLDQVLRWCLAQGLTHNKPSVFLVARVSVRGRKKLLGSRLL